MYLSTYYLEYGRRLALLRRRRRRRRRSYAPTSNTASHENHETIHSWVTSSLLYEYGAPLGGPSGRRSCAIIEVKNRIISSCIFIGFCELYSSKQNVKSRPLQMMIHTRTTEKSIKYTDEQAENIECELSSVDAA